MLAGVAALAVFAVIEAGYAMQVLWLRTHDPATSHFMREQAERLAAETPPRALEHRWVPYERIAGPLKRAVIASEDARFPAHDGVDWDAIERAWQTNAQRGHVALGGSTITMQLARNLFLSGSRSYVRKAQEVLIAYAIEAALDKRRILELYLNLAEWGDGVFGAEAAAWHHYNVPAARLSAAQAARLAAMLPRPRHFDHHRADPALSRRAAILLRRMPAVAAP